VYYARNGTVQAHFVVAMATDGKWGDVATRWVSGVAIHTYIRLALLAGNVDGAYYVHRGYTDTSLNACVCTWGNISTGPCIHSLLCVLACLFARDVVPGAAVRGRVSRIVNNASRATCPATRKCSRPSRLHSQFHARARTWAKNERVSRNLANFTYPN